MKTATTLLTTAAAGCIAGLIAGFVASDGSDGNFGQVPAAETVFVQSGRFSYRLPGEYLASNRPADAPLRELDFPRGFQMMKYQVSAADYARCVADGACEKADGAQSGEDVPVTGVNQKDATDYAAWLSKKTGIGWRLPTDAEWMFAAAERFNDDSLGLTEDDGANPAVRWLARYRQESGNAAPDPQPKRYGYFGANSKGLADMSGNVWDWTSTCYVRAAVEADGTLGPGIENCGVRVAGGKHRAYMSFFIRDGKSGGCAAGMAPHNLGIRLVREQSSLLVRIKAALRSA